MFGGGRKSSDGPIGVDVGDHTIRMLQLTFTEGNPSAVAAASRPLGQGISSRSGGAYHTTVADAIRDMLATGHFRGRHVVSCLPAASIQCKNIRLPRMPRDELASAVQFEATERLKFSGDAMSVQFFDAGEVLQGQDAKQEIIILASPKKFINEHLNSIRSCDLDPCAIDAVPGALSRCIEHAHPVDEDDPAVRVVIDVGFSGTKVLIMRGRRVCFFKVIDVGGWHMDQALATRLQLSVSAATEVRRGWMNGHGVGEDDARITSTLEPLVEELSREVGLCLRYYSVTFRGRRPEEAWIIGGESGNAWLWARLCEDSGLKPSGQDPLASLDLTKVQKEIGGPDAWAGWGVAAGLALRDIRKAKGKRRSAA